MGSSPHDLTGSSRQALTSPEPKGEKQMLLDEFTGKASQVIDATPDEVFAAITDLDRLPSWNAHIPTIVERPGGPLATGVEWVVRINALGTHWNSRSRVVVHDPEHHRFGH